MNIFIFTGLSASGKSTISTGVSASLKLPRIDLHGIIHQKATEAGFNRARDWIFSIGIPEALSESRSTMSREIANNKNAQGVIVDEVIDMNTLDYLKSEFHDDQFTIIYVRANRHDRRHFMGKRLDAKDGIVPEEIKFIDRLKESVGIRDIIQIADIRIENYKRLEDTINEITDTLYPRLTRRERL